MKAQRGRTNHMKVQVAQWIGKRVDMEDSYAVRHFQDGSLAVVCDGMGGHDCGYQAAEIAARSFVKAFEQLADEVTAKRMRDALDFSNKSVGDFFTKRGMYGGCTLLAVYVSSGVLWWVSVGDSPLLLWRHGRLQRLNADHSMRSIYEEFVKTGSMSFEEAMSLGHPLRSAVTGEKIPLIDSPPTPYLLLPGDRIVLASDGVDELLLPIPLSEAARVILDSRSDNLSAEIVEGCRALGREDADNVTVLSMDFAPAVRA